MSIVEADAFKIYLRERWDQPWTEQQNISAVQITSRVAPGVSEARFLYRIGIINPQGSANWVTRSALDLNEQFIRVVLDTDESPTLFVGIISVRETDVRGVGSGGSDSGDMVFTAYGLEHLLDRVHVHAGFCKPDDTLEADVVEMDWSPTFNVRQRRGGAVSGNRSQTPTGEVYAFASVPSNANDPAALWNHRQILDYLMWYFAPVMSQGMTWNITGQVDVLNNLVTVQDVEGLKLREALNRLIYRGWGLGWRVYYDENADRPAVQIFTYLSEPVVVDDLVIPANEEVEDRNIDDSALVSGAFIKTATAARYEKIVVQGARVKTCFTLSHADGTLTSGWTSALETAYKTAKGGAATAEENDADRSRDRYAQVFSRFRVPGNWNGEAGNGAGGAKHTAFPDVDEDGNLDADTEKFGGLIARSFLRRLPLRKGYDYTADPPTQLIDNDDTSEFLAPIVLVKDDETLGWYLHVENASRAKKEGDPTRQNARASMDDAQLAVLVVYEHNHILARGHWSGANASKYDPSSGNDWATDWEDMVVTVAMAADARLRVVALTEPGAALDRLLVINVPDAELWYVLPGTVVSIKNDGTLERIAGSSGQTIRDDGDRLRRIAALAQRWYGQPRAAIALTSYDLNNYSDLGVLLTCKAVNGATEDVTGVVTSVEWDGQSRKVTTRTDFIDLDVVALASGLTGSAQITSREDLVRTVRKQGEAIAEIEEETGNLPVRWADGPFERERYVQIAEVADFGTLNNQLPDTANGSVLDPYWFKPDGTDHERRLVVKANQLLGTPQQIGRLALSINSSISNESQVEFALEADWDETDVAWASGPGISIEVRAITVNITPSTLTWNQAYVTDGGLLADGGMHATAITIPLYDHRARTPELGGLDAWGHLYPGLPLVAVPAAWNSLSAIYGFEFRYVISSVPGVTSLNITESKASGQWYLDDMFILTPE